MHMLESHKKARGVFRPDYCEDRKKKRERDFKERERESSMRDRHYERPSETMRVYDVSF